jgi:uncharacterized protein (TIGR00730 family)
MKKLTKAYKNFEFLNSPAARTIRILAEYHEPLARFQKYGIKNSIVFFGSSRAFDFETVNKKVKHRNYDKAMKLAKYYDDAVELSKKLTQWSMSKKSEKQLIYICSGGGPGIMEAANKGAQLAGGKSIGLNISIPMEQDPNPYISPELMFEFHYFFIRKFWFVYMAKALVIFPGGYGTMDELMEVLTLIQTEKITKNLPIVIYGEEYWNDIINFKSLVEWGTIAEEDVNLFYFSNSVEDAYKYLTSRIKL